MQYQKLLQYTTLKRCASNALVRSNIAPHKQAHANRYTNTKKNMSYLQTQIIRKLNGNMKKISAPTMKIGDRFLRQNDDSLWFKLDVDPIENHYLCCNETGITERIDGDTKVKRINGIAGAMLGVSRQIVQEFRETEKQ